MGGKRLTDEQRVKVLADSANGVLPDALATELGCTRGTILRVIAESKKGPSDTEPKPPRVRRARKGKPRTAIDIIQVIKAGLEELEDMLSREDDVRTAAQLRIDKVKRALEE